MDIELLSSDQLLEELKKRFDACIFHGVKANYKGKEEDIYLANACGDIATTIGLCVTLKHRLLKEYKPTRDADKD